MNDRLKFRVGFSDDKMQFTADVTQIDYGNKYTGIQVFVHTDDLEKGLGRELTDDDWEHLDNQKDIEWCEGADSFIFSSKYLEQCTGLRDKNVTLIYEGDIIGLTDDGGGIEQIGPLKQDGYGAWIVQQSYDEVGYLMDYVSYCLYNGRENYAKIIGNIHENKDLLNE